MHGFLLDVKINVPIFPVTLYYHTRYYASGPYIQVGYDISEGSGFELPFSVHTTFGRTCPLLPFTFFRRETVGSQSHKVTTVTTTASHQNVECQSAFR